MASSDLTLTLTLQQVNRERLFQIRDSLKQLYGVTLIINSNSIYDNGSNSDILSSQSGSEILKCVGKQDGHRSFALRAGGTAFSAAATSLHAGAAPEILSSVTLHFQTYGSQENIEMAKNFTRTHLIPSTDYVVRTHPLSQEEFDMVLQSSQNIQTSTSALLSFNPDCLEVTLQGTQNNVTAAGAKVVMLLEQLRDQSDLESNIHVSHGHPFHDNLCLSTFTKKQNDDISKMPCSVAKERITSDCQKNDFSSISTNSYQNRTQGSPTLWNIQPHSPVTVAKSNHSHDTEQDCAYNSNSPTEGNTHMDDLEKTFGLALKEPSFSSSSSSDNESELEDNILTDPRYSKQVEQALKLGYSESHVKTALTKLGPDCNFNDLLSELIKIGASDSVPEDVSSFSSSSSDPQPSSQDHNSRSSGSFVDVNDSSNLRDIIIDGSNVAMSHGKTVFSCKGIQIAVDWFRQRGHKAITVIVPLWRKETSRPDAPITDQHILSELEKEKIVVFTPSRRVQGKRVVCYDDRFILNLAVDTEGIVVSNDVYRDLVSEKEAYRKVVDERLLMYSFASDRFYPPEDPLGRLGPTLDNFLRKTPAEPTTKPADCPYGKKCTYGNKCRFYHPERGFAPQKSITDTLKEQADLKLQERAKMSEMAEKGKRPKQKLARTKALAPGEPLPFSTVSSTPGVEGSGRREKPKLVHSKSLGPPSKTSGYLDESRRKLEEAEMSGALEKMSLSSESSRASPILQRDITKQMMASADTLFHSSSPVKTGGSKSPRASPAHLTVPKPEQQERYLSGHLLLAKKLSDESTDNNFFSEHTSSPSSTRTSSPVVPASKTMEQKSSANIEPQHGEELGRFGFSPPNMQQTFGSQEQDNIPNLSISESGPSRQILYSDSGDSGSSGYKYSSIDSPRPTDFVMSSVFLRSPDSGNFSASDPLSHLSHNHTDYPPPQNVQQQFHGYPLLPRADQGHYSQEHPNLRRSFSSTCNVKNVEVHQKLGRRGSAFISAQKEHPVLRPQNSMPGHFSLGPSTLTRQNSTSDPQIHNTFDQAEYPPSGFSPPRKFQDPYPMHTQPHQGDSRQMQLLQQYQLQQQYQQHQQLPFETQHYPRMPQRQDSVILSPQVKQNISPWGEAPSYRNVGHRASLGGQATSSYNPHQSSFSLQNSGHVQYFPASMGERGVMPSNTLSTSPSVPPQMPHYQQPHIFSPPFSPVPRTVSPQSFPQVQYSLPNYPQQPNFSSPHTGQAPPAQPGAQIRQPSPVMTEDTHILPDDPRYSLYYHLSSVFGEAVVRKVMNLNSCVNDPDQLCTLIMKYKEETGR